MEDMSLFTDEAFWAAFGPKKEKLRADYLIYACAALQRNDPTLDFVCASHWKWPEGYLRPMGEAILHNTVVTELDLHMTEMVPVSLDAEDIQESDMEATALAAEPLLRYLRSSPSLRRVSLNEDISGACVENPALHWLCCNVLKAIAERPILVKLCLWIAVPMQEFADLLSGTQTVRYLELNVDCLHSGGDDDRLSTIKPLTIQALRANQSLETLRLLHYDENSSLWSKDLLEPLASHPNLQCIKLFCCGFPISIPKTLPLVLQQSTTLQEIAFEQYDIGKKSWNKVIKALQLNSSVQRLVLEDCRFTGKKAIEYFIQAFQATRKIVNNDGTPDRNIVEVSLCSSRLLFDEFTLAKVLGQIWKDPVKPRRARQEGHSFLQTTSLCVACARCGLKDVAENLPHATHLRALSTKESRNIHGDSLCHCNGNLNADALVRAVQCNGSLHSVDVEVEPDHAKTVRRRSGESKWPLLGERRLRLMGAYCERNRMAPQLLAKRLDLLDDEHDKVQQLQIVPPVFAAMQPAWKMSPNTLLIGLTAAAGPATIGRHGDSLKRIGQQGEAARP
jgi:hypothetical protein